MRTLALSLFAAGIVACSIGCSQNTVLPDPNDVAPSQRSGHVSAQLDYFIKIEPIDGEAAALEEAMDIYSGNGAVAIGLLVPAVQKVREAASRLQEGADREGNINAGDAEKAFRKLIASWNPRGDGYSLKDIVIASIPQAQKGREGWIEIIAYGDNEPANVESELFHIYNGIRIIMEDAGVDDDAINRAMENLLNEIALLSDEHPEA